MFGAVKDSLSQQRGIPKCSLFNTCRVEAVHERFYEDSLVTVHTEGGSFRSTTYHPVWVLAGRQLADRPACTELTEHEDEGLALPGRWVNSHDLRPGDVLLAADGTQRYVVRTEQEFVSGLPPRASRSRGLAGDRQCGGSLPFFRWLPENSR